MDPVKDLVEKVKAASYAETSRLAEIINDFDRTLELRWIPDAKRGPEDVFPYCIVQHTHTGDDHLVMYLTPNEIANPPGVLARLFNSRNDGKGGVLKRIESAEAARKIWEAKQEVDRQAEKMDFWKSVWNTKLHTYRHNGRKLSL